MSNNSITAAEHFAAIPLPESIDHLTGPLPFRMTNDVLFHLLFETNPTALRGLICSLLNLEDSDIHSIEVKNPIEFGKTVFSKGFILDLKLLLNNNTSINVEMQVLKTKNWTERSLSYLCRSYDKLNVGEDYFEANTAIHIGILDYDLFPEDEAKFYTTYHLADDITHKIYTGKFRLSVLYLNHVDKATDEDIACHLDYWAKFFKATTWEDLKMLAEKSPTLKEATKTVYNTTADLCAQTMLEAYEEYEKVYRTIKREAEEEVAQSRKEAAQSRETLAQKKEELAQREATIAQNNVVIAQQQSEIAQQQSEIAQQQSEIAQQQSEIAQQQARIAFLEAQLAGLQSNQ